MLKKELRALYLQKRQTEISHEDAEIFSLQMRDIFFAKINLQHYNKIHLFLPIKEKKEVNTWLIIQTLWTQFPETQILIPKVTNNQLQHYLLTPETPLKQNNWGITEPEESLSPTDLIPQMVLIPLLCYDAKGNRIGYGKGYYDRFLATLPPETWRLGVSFFQNTPSIIADTNPYDIPLHACLTPKGIQYFEN